MNREQRQALKAKCEAQKAITAAPAPQPAPEPPKQAKTRQEGNGAAKKGKPANGQIFQACGHPVAVAYLEKSICPDCRARARAEKFARKRAAQQARPKRENLYRLPIGSCHESHYVQDGLWKGELRIPCPNPDDPAVHCGYKTFVAEAPGLGQLEHLLFEMYLASHGGKS